MGLNPRGPMRHLPDRIRGNRNSVVFSEESQKKKGMPISLGIPLVFALDRLNWLTDQYMSS